MRSFDSGLRARQRGDHVDDLGRARDARVDRVHGCRSDLQAAGAAALQLGLDPAPRGADAARVGLVSDIVWRVPKLTSLRT
jgi:hypothetical protein